MSKKVVVIGGGLSGLTTAALLAQQGYDVTLLEKNLQLGGRARIFSANGFMFDMGPSWYLMPEVIEKIFETLGYKTSDFFKLKMLPTKYKVFFDDQEPISLTNDSKANYALFEKIEPHSSNRIQELIKISEKIYNVTVKNFFNHPYHSPLDFLTFSELKNGISLLLKINPFQSYHDFVKKYVKNSKLQKIFEFHTVFLGGDPFQTPALYSMLIAADFKQKVWYPMGGMGELVTALTTIVKKNKVKILTNFEVTSLIIDQKKQKITGVKSKDQEIVTDYVVNTMDYASFDQNILPETYQEYSKEYWKKKSYSISSILVYLGINKKIPQFSHHNFYFQKDWERHFQTLKTSELPQNPCFYISAPSTTDPSVAPKNMENLFILIPTSITTDEKNISKYVDHVLDHIEKVTKTKFVDSICYKRIYSKKDFEKDYTAYSGNALGLSHTLSQSVFLRPRMKSKHLKNLYYAGQFTQPGVGVPMVLLSALYASRLLQNENR